jgi:C_GCAxxG_C_C family probable redox protein
VCQEHGIESDVVPRIASCFAGGIGNTGSVCGSVSGAVMALGLLLEQGNEMEHMLRNLAVAQEFRRRFEAETDSIECRTLTGLDLTTEEGIGKLMEGELPMMVCFPAVTAAYRIVMELLQEHAPPAA